MQTSTARTIDLTPIKSNFGRRETVVFSFLEDVMKKKILAVGLLLAGTLGAAVSAQAMDNRARFMAANCSYCHGTNGKSAGAIPSLAGLDAKYFVDQMKAFRDGSRPATVMAKHANGYTDAEYEAMAKYFAAVK
jgi:cytochrome c553